MLEAVSGCLLNFRDLANGLPLGDLIDYATTNGFGQTIIEGLQKLSAAAGVLVFDGPEVVWDFANDAGMTDALVEREQQRQDEAVARELDPNSLINVLGRRERS